MSGRNINIVTHCILSRNIGIMDNSTGSLCNVSLLAHSGSKPFICILLFPLHTCFYSNRWVLAPRQYNYKIIEEGLYKYCLTTSPCLEEYLEGMDLPLDGVCCALQCCVYPTIALEETIWEGRDCRQLRNKKKTARVGTCPTDVLCHLMMSHDVF